MLKIWWLAFRGFLTLFPIYYFYLDFFISLVLLSLSHSILIPFLAFSLHVGPCPGREPLQARLANSPGLDFYQLLLKWARSCQCFLLFLKFDNSMNTHQLFGDSPVLKPIRCPIAPSPWLLPDRRWLHAGLMAGGGLSPLTYILWFMVMLCPSVLL